MHRRLWSWQCCRQMYVCKKEWAAEPRCLKGYLSPAVRSAFKRCVTIVSQSPHIGGLLSPAHDWIIWEYGQETDTTVQMPGHC